MALPDWDTFKLRLKVMAGLGVACWLFAQWNIKQASQVVQETLAETERGPAVLPAGEGSAAAPPDPTWKLWEELKAAAKAADWDKAELLRLQLASLSQGDESKSRLWRDSWRGFAQNAFSSGDDALADRLMKPELKEPPDRGDISGIQLRRAYSALRLRRWKKNFEAGDKAAAEEDLEAAFAADPYDSDLHRVLSSSWPKEELVSTGRALLAKGKNASGFSFLLAADQDSSLKVDHAALRRDMDTALLALGKEAEEAGLVDRRLFVAAPYFYDRVATRGPAYDEAQRRSAACTLATAEADEKAERFPAAEQGYAQAIAHLERTGQDASPVRARMPRFQGRYGTWLLKSDPERAAALLRPVLRAVPDPSDMALIEGGLRQAVKLAKSRSDFDKLIDLSAFYLAEVGTPPAEDPFRRELIDSLQGLAKDSAGRSLNRRVFVLTVLAEGFPNDPEGKAAADEALQRGMEVVKGVAETKMTKKSLPSGLSGLSVVAVENGTSHHILAFYEGPERFFLRLKPFRRGVAVMRDGAYLKGVMTTSDEIIPARSQVRHASDWTFDRYVLSTRGAPQEASAAYVRSSEDYVLLRAPAGTGPFVVDKDQGRVTAAK